MSTKTYPDLDERIMHADPIAQFQLWFDDARKAGIAQPEAMTLATASAEGRPSARVVLLKLVDERGFVFYTNYNSRKGKELSANPVAALVFFWEEMHRSIRVEGNVTKLSPNESDEYFAARPRDGQLSSLTSSQSEAVESREVLDKKFEELKGKYEGRAISRPSHWGGYRVYPHRLEFWQQRFARLNDRIEYQRNDDRTWLMRRLQP